MGLRKLALLSIAVLIAAGLLWKVIGSGTSSVVPDRSIGEREKLPAVSVLSVRPGLAGPASSPASLVPAFSPPVASANLSQFRARKDYASLYQRLQGDLSPEALYLKAEIYERCARHDGKSALDLAQESAARRAKFISGIPQSKADAPKRIEAFDRLYSDPCSGMDLGAFSSQEFARLLAAAADAGDVHAQATQLADRVEGANHESQGRIAYQMTEADLAQARQLLASADPDVINVLQGILSSTLESGSIRLDGEPFDPHAMYSAFDLLACDAGRQCGPEAPQILASCAYRGQCFANNLYEYSYYYQNSPSESQLVDDYRRSLLAMLNARNFSGLTYSPTDTNSGFRVTIGRGRRGG